MLVEFDRRFVDSENVLPLSSRVLSKFALFPVPSPCNYVDVKRVRFIMRSMACFNASHRRKRCKYRRTKKKGGEKKGKEKRKEEKTRAELLLQFSRMIDRRPYFKIGTGRTCTVLHSLGYRILSLSLPSPSSDPCVISVFATDSSTRLGKK